MQTLRKRQEGLQEGRFQEGVKGEVRLVERCFYLGKRVLAEAIELLEELAQKDPESVKAF